MFHFVIPLYIAHMSPLEGLYIEGRELVILLSSEDTDVDHIEKNIACHNELRYLYLYYYVLHSVHNSRYGVIPDRVKTFMVKFVTKS